MFHVFKSRLFMTHAVKDCLKYVAIKGWSVQEFIRFSDFSRWHFTVSGQVIPTSQRGWRKWATGKTIPCLNNTMSKSRYKHPTAFEQFPCDIPLSKPKQELHLLSLDQYNTCRVEITSTEYLPLSQKIRKFRLEFK